MLARLLAGKNLFAGGLLTGSATYLVSNLLSAAIPFLLLPVLTRYLAPVQYGQVAIYQTLLAAVVAFIGLTANGAAAVKYYENDVTAIELKYFVGSCFLVLAGTTAMALLIAAIFLGPLSTWLGLEAHWIFLSVVVACATFTVSMRMTQWQIRKQAARYGGFQVANSLTNMLLSLILVVGLQQGAQGRILGLSIAPLCFAALALFLLYREGLLGFTWRPVHLREIATYGIPLIPHSVGYFLLASFDRLVINAQLGEAKVGAYMAAAQLASGLGLVFDAINNAYVPWLFERLKRNQTEEKRQIVRGTYFYFLLLAVVVALGFTIAPAAVLLVAGERYADGAQVISWLVLGWVFHGMYLMVTNYVFFSKRTLLLSMSTVTAGLVNIGLLLILVPHYGLQGAALAFAISSALKMLLTWCAAQFSHPMPWFDFHRHARP
jgi:O-antigen/teichoic acid export membrane protein